MAALSSEAIDLESHGHSHNGDEHSIESDGEATNLSSPVDVPLCVDLDGTLVNTDTMIECISLYLKKNPIGIVLLVFWFFRGRAFFKWQLARKTKLNYLELPYNRKLVGFLKKEHKKGRTLVLVTGANKIIADKIAEHLRVFDKVYASNASINLVGKNKAVLLTALYGKQKFDYCGDSAADLKVWKFANRAIVVNGRRRIGIKVKSLCPEQSILGIRQSMARSLIKILRPHQWAKNVLVFFPMILANTISLELIYQGVIAFVSFCLVASSGYVFNDLLDVGSDRKNKSKNSRPFASGDLSVLWGVTLIPLLLGLSVGASLMLSLSFAGLIITYFVMTVAYSIKLKRLEIADVIMLASFYTLRIFSGGVGTGTESSVWLIGFSSFFFLNLALVKRSSELMNKSNLGGEATLSRGYRLDDQPQLSMLGSVAGFVSILVLALYINSEEVMKLYVSPQYLWIMCIVLMYWISRYWLITNRGQMSHDPVLYALKDRASWVAAVIIAGAWLVARGGSGWW